MPRFIQKHKHEIGLSPDDLVFRGHKKEEEVRLRIIDFDPEELLEKTLGDINDAASFQEKDTVTWLNIDGLHNQQVMQGVVDAFDLERMVMAEVMNTTARPKVTEYENCTLVSIKMIQQDEQSDRLSIENLSILLTDSVLISFQEKRGDVFEPVRERIRKHKKRIRNGGADYLLFALLDIVIDNYLYAISVLGEKIEALEENLLLNPTQDVISEINRFKRELNFLRKNIKPAKEMVFGLAKLESDQIAESTFVHFKELQDNITQASESTDSYRDILSDQLNIYHTTISSKLNDIMKFLTVFSVVFIPLTFIAGIYGTNFEFVPELQYKYSYFIMWGVMLTVAIGMMVYFRRKKWL